MHVTGHDTIAVTVGYVGLRDGRVALLAAQFGLEAIIEVDVAEVAHRQVLEVQAVTVEVEHRKVANGTLRLTTLRGQHHRIGLRIQTLQTKVGTLNDHTKGIFAHRAGNIGIVGIVNPIDPGGQIDPHRLLGRTRHKVGGGLLEGVIDIGEGIRLGIGQRAVDVDAFRAQLDLATIVVKGRALE